MGERLVKAQFIIIHMLQYEVLMTFVITAALLWGLNLKLSSYSTKTKEAKMARQAALVSLGILGLIAVLGQVLR